MAAQLKCSHCRKVRRCQMFKMREEPVTGVKGWLAGTVEYLCSTCARELGYIETKEEAR